jgi:hypothetical protein
VSAAYYALFHLLVSEAIVNWKQVSLRTSLGRGFDHSTMKAAAKRVQDPREFPYAGEPDEVVHRLRSVAKTFAQLQEKRHLADYDNGTLWTRTESVNQVQAAVRAFALWKSIREEDIAQAFLVALMVRKRG